MSNNHVYDMIVVGGGPGGYTAALYAARAGLDTIVLEKLSAGGQMALTEQIDNYPGFENGIDGFSLAEKMQKQAERFGARSEYAEVLRMDLTAVPKLVETSEGIFRGKTVVLATGADPRTLGVNAIFDVSQSVIASSAGVIQGSTDISPDMLADLEATLETMGLGSLLGLWLQSIFIGFTMTALNIVIFVLIYGRMLEIYMLTSLAPIPVATLSNREMGSMGQNYLKSLFAIGFQGLLILLCVGIYAVLIQGIATGGDPIGAIWGAVGYTVLLCFMLFKTGTISKSIFGAH